MAVTVAEEIAEASVVVAAIGAGWVAVTRDAIRRRLSESRARRRSRHVEAAAAEAGLEVSAFAPDQVRAAVSKIIDSATSREGDRPQRDTDALVRRWAQTRGLSSTVAVVAGPTIDLLGLVNEDGETEDRVVARVRLEFLPASSRRRGPGLRIDDRFTLARRGESWILAEFDATPLSDALLSSPVIADASGNEQRLREQALVELAAADRPVRVAPSELVDPDASSSRQLLDLAVADPLFEPALIALELQELVKAWEQASYQQPAQLARRASPGAQAQLLSAVSHGEALAIVVRDAHLVAWEPLRIVRLSPDVIIEVSLSVRAVRYLTDPMSGIHRYGSPEHPHKMTMRWTLRLEGSEKTPWQLIDSSSPVVDVPGVEL